MSDTDADYENPNGMTKGAVIAIVVGISLGLIVALFVGLCGRGAARRPEWYGQHQRNRDNMGQHGPYAEQLRQIVIEDEGRYRNYPPPQAGGARELPTVYEGRTR